MSAISSSHPEPGQLLPRVAENSWAHALDHLRSAEIWLGQELTSKDRKRIIQRPRRKSSRKPADNYILNLIIGKYLILLNVVEYY
jgi:hypothetical protein